MATPSTVTHYHLLVGPTESLAGKAEATPAELKLIMQDYSSGGMAGTVKIPDGSVEPIEQGFKLFEINAAVLSTFGIRDGVHNQFILRMAQRAPGGAVTTVQMTMRGILYSYKLSELKAKQIASVDCMVSCDYYRLDLGGVAIHEVDVERGINIVNGKDLMADVRQALGWIA
ncbi:MAG: phage major tail tube protein [Zoogloeaceae bacterium]|nr:phage major tail tube protein [Zoogloeaceae bacterium]